MKNRMHLSARCHALARSVKEAITSLNRNSSFILCPDAANIKRILVQFLGFALFTVFAHNSFAALTPGAIPGSFSVSESGAASYSISIAVPPGTGGMEPKLSLNYSSQGGNGIAGVGWSLGGLSAITRCPQTIIHDGAARGVQLDTNDRFCLDGQRLILVTTGTTYGTIGAEYRTEIESFSKIVSIGGGPGDPQSFQVWTKAGHIIEFGNTADSHVEAQGKSVAAAWAVNKISDTVGNYIAFTYFEDNANGEHRIARIDYTGNASASVSPYNALEFQYEARPDTSLGYLAGSLMRQTQRLVNIQTKTSGTLVMNYALNYETGTTTGRSRLASLSQCAADGNCLASSTFAWQEGQAASFGTEINSPAITGTTANTWFAMGDVNGDGKTDLVTFNTSRDMRQYTADGTGAMTQTQQFISPFVSVNPAAFNPGEWRFFLADLNGDGFAEPVSCGVAGYVNLAYDKGWVGVPWITQPNGNGQASIVMQATRSLYLGAQPYAVLTWKQWCMPTTSPDGRNGLNWYAAEYWKGFELFSNINADATYGQLTFTQEGASVPLSNADSSIAQTGDINGDGAGDMVRYDSSTGALHIWLQQSGAFAPVTNLTIDASGSPKQSWFQLADVNGDGLGDMVLHDPSAGSIKVWLSKGDGTVGNKVETLGFSTGGTPGDTWLEMVDINSDGRADAVKYNPATGTVTVALSNGDGSFGSSQSLASLGAGTAPTLGLGPAPTSSWFQPADVNGDGLPDWVRYDPSSGKVKVNLGLGEVPDRLLSITDGRGATRNISYKPLTNPIIYSKGTGAVYPEQDVQAAMYVVSETAADDGIGGQFRISYRYTGARTHLTGRGFLGFATLEQTDLQTGIVTRTNYSQTFPYIGMPTLVTKTASGGVELGRVENTYAEKILTGAGKFPYLAYSKEQSKDLNGAILPITETWNVSFDDWGNVTKITTQTSDGFLKTTDNTYNNDPGTWVLGRLTRASVSASLNGGTQQTRVSAFEYNATTGLLTKEIIEPDAANVQFRLDTAYTHDAFGNRKTTTVFSPATGNAAIATRTTTTTYDARGQFPVTIANALSHTENKTYDPRFGTVKTLTGPNALTTTWQYDSFGRKTQELRADGTQTVWTYQLCDAACPGTGVYRIFTQVYGVGNIQAAPTTAVYFDRLNRSVRQAAQGFDGRWIYTDTDYDNQGRVKRSSRPYYALDAAYWTTPSYDDLGRTVRIDNPDGSWSTLVYNGLTTVATNAKNQTSTTLKNSQGQTVSVTDALLQTAAYAYDPFGNLLATRDPAGNQIVNLYDLRGRKTQTTDPDLGLWKYEHNALGELVKQTDAKNQVSTFDYDLLGRLTQRIEPGLTSDWVYDTAASGKGKLHTAKTSAGYLRTHFYDSKGRPRQVVNNLEAGNALMWSNTAYDISGRVSEQWYGGEFGVKQIYNARGYLAEVRNASSNALYWRGDQMDAEGHILQETYGNGVVTRRAHTAQNGRLEGITAVGANGAPIQSSSYAYDTLGNIWQHSDDSGDDYLGYDRLNRLTRTQRSTSSSTVTVTATYDALGNLTSKGDAGNYYYGGDTLCAAGNGAGRHAVCKAGNNAYAYDANGNFISGGGRSATWTGWNMPQTLTQAGQTTDWSYGPEHERYKMTTPGRTTWYMNPSVHQGGHYEETRYASEIVETRYTLYGGGQPIGEVLNFGDAAPAQTRYFHSDHQGSITAVTNSDGAVLTRYRYDPWGKQTVVFGSNGGFAKTRQGHTGHEMLDGGLTHMNGRLYDPVLARFVSADPIVDNPYDLQSLNRYTYVLNNPLYYTDPTGFSAWTDFRDGFLKPVASIVVSIYAPGLISGLTGWGMTASSIAAGGIAGGITGGGRGALAGAVSAGMFSQLHGMEPGIGKIAAHGVAGGLMSEMQGGSFKSGFLAAGFTQGASELGLFDNLGSRSANAIGAAIVGGTASVIGGGKFANGAMTGAFSRLFNDLNDNQIAGRAAERATVEGLEAQGYEVVTQVRLRLGGVGGTLAIADYAYRVDDRIIFGEVKDGLGAALSANQRAVYEELIASGRVAIEGSAFKDLGLKAGSKYAVALTVNAAAGSRALRQVGRMIGSRYVGGALTLLGSAPLMAADLFSYSGEAGSNSGCVGCLNGGR